MKEFLVEIYTVDFCGFSDVYTVMAEDEDDAGDLALEEYSQDFADRYDLQAVGFGEYAESCDIDEDGNYDEDETTTLSTRIL